MLNAKKNKMIYNHDTSDVFKWFQAFHGQSLNELEVSKYVWWFEIVVLSRLLTYLPLILYDFEQLFFSPKPSCLDWNKIHLM